MDISDNYINQRENERLRNALVDLLFGQINNVSSFDISNNAMNTPPIVGNTSSDLNPERNSLDNEYISFFRNYLFRSVSNPRVNFESILQQSLTDPSQNMYKNVLSKEGEKQIKTCFFKKGEFPNDTCSITLAEFKEGETVKQLPCGHIFKPDAIDKWLKNEQARCPICRKELASKEIKKEKNLNENVVLGNRVRTGIRPRTINRRSFITNYISNQIQREEEAELQAAIIASLREQNN